MQLLCNPFFGRAFDTEMIMIGGFPYNRLLPHIGQSFHRLLDYCIVLAVILIFLVKSVRSPRIYAERYSVILITMVISCVWQSYYIFSRTTVDRSMIGFAVFGLMVFYFAIYYRPLRLLDRMLAYIASEMPEALFFFDEGGRCIWANSPAIALANILIRSFRSEDYICRIGGDEFVVFMVHSDDRQKDMIASKIDRINEELSHGGDGLSAVSVSVGIAMGHEGTDQSELFGQADMALYETKRNGRCGHTFYTPELAVRAEEREG